jgi:penicillin-binding protein 2
VFERRLKWFAILMIAVALLIIARLVDVQIVRAGEYQALADRMLVRPVTYLSAPRGSILDRNGQLLVSDEPTSDISVRYEALLTLLSDEPPPAATKYLEAVARSLRACGRFPADMPTEEIVPQLHAGIRALPDELARLTGVGRDELLHRAERIRWQVEQIKSAVQARSPTTWKVREEEIFHPLITGVGDDLALAVRIQLEPEHPWLAVLPSARRIAHDADSLVHVLGRVGAASPKRIDADPLADDELRGLRSGDRCGISGVERLGELALRGTRGYVIEDLDRTVLKRVNPLRGGDVTLTINADLQRATFALLEQAVQESQDTDDPAGGAAAVILDVATRNVIALVSYPAYGYDEYAEDYARLARDTRWFPLRFRAVAEMYPPGSTCKVIGLYGGLAEGVVTKTERIECRGYFRPDHPNQFRCWINTQYGSSHGPQNAEDAIRNSCNIFFYTVGDRLGVDRLCKWFSAFGLGRTQGTGLIEESAGIVPTSQWIAKNRAADPRVEPADAWNFAIGQGEVSATPLQSANVAATVASGRWEPVKLARDDKSWLGDDAAEPVVFNESILHVLRTGMWRVVNEPGGTAARYARLDSDKYVLCGKTGSAQTSRRVVRKKYTLQWPDGRTEEVVATSRDAALAQFPDEQPEVVDDAIVELFPASLPEGKLPSHAWFIGYTQSADTPRGERPNGRSYALSVIVEYGGSGGHVAGPVAKAIAELLVDGEW